MKIAIVLTVKNERELLSSNLRYHTRIGVDHAFVYLDQTTDDTAQTVAGLEYVSIEHSRSPANTQERHRLRPELHKVIEKWSTHGSARQMLNAYLALQEARRRGFDWLISIDPDELVWPRGAAIAGQPLKTYLASIPNHIDLVRFMPVEAVQRPQPYPGVVFQHETLFKTVYRASRSGIEKIDNLRKRIQFPASKETRTAPGYFGQTMGKCAVRTRVDALPMTVHLFTASGGRALTTLSALYLLHYWSYDTDNLIQKFRNFSNHPSDYVYGSPVPTLTAEIQRFVNSPTATQAQIRDWFAANLAYHPAEIAELRQLHPCPLVEVDAAARIFTEIGNQPPPQRPTPKNGSRQPVMAAVVTPPPQRN